MSVARFRDPDEQPDDGYGPAGPTPPHDAQAEMAVLAEILRSKDNLRVALDLVRPEDFYRPVHQALYRVCVKLAEDRQPVDAVTVASVLQSTGEHKLLPALADILGYAAITPTGASARIVQDRARLRQLLEFAAGLTQRAYVPGEQSAETLIAWAADQTRALRDSGVMGDDDITAMMLDEYLAQEITHDWVIPGLLDAGDRLLLTGQEGLGKSYLTRQIAVCAAAGLHPFTQQRIEPKKVLVVDAENSVKINAKAYRWLINACHGMQTDPMPRFFIDSYPYGMDVMSPREGNKLIRTVEAQRPDLVVIGPVYKIHQLDDEKAGEALRIQKYLDRLRSVCNSTLVMELHSPHGAGHQRDMRPAGSSVWRRWPEFGYGLRAASTDDGVDEEVIRRERLTDVVAWRGPRDERDWPIRLRSSRAWPWIPANIDPQGGVW